MALILSDVGGSIPPLIVVKDLLTCTNFFTLVYDLSSAGIRPLITQKLNGTHALIIG